MWFSVDRMSRLFYQPAEIPTAMKIVVAIAFILIIGSLGSALIFMMRDKGKGERMVRALAFRVGFSIALFLLILIAYHFGLIEPTGIPYQR